MDGTSLKQAVLRCKELLQKHPADGSADRPGWRSAVLWLLLSACGSGLLMATTNQMSLDVASIPFLWVGRLASEAGLGAIYIDNHSSRSRRVSSSDWILLTKNRAFVDVTEVHEDRYDMPKPGALWTDDFSSVFKVVDF